MSELKPCPLCEAHKPFGTVTPEVGAPSGDSGYRMTIKCRECGCAITRWALKKAWAISSAETAWNRRAQPDNAPLTLEELRGMDGEPVWVKVDESKTRFFVTGWYEVQIQNGRVYFKDNTGDRFTRIQGTAYRRKQEPEGGDR